MGDFFLKFKVLSDMIAPTDGTKAGMSAENGAKQAVNKTATMTVEEARQILGIDPNATPEQVMQVFDTASCLTTDLPRQSILLSEQT